MKTHYYILFVLNILTFYQCIPESRNDVISKSKYNKNLIALDIDILDYNKNFNFSSLFSSYKAIPLETNKDCLIGKITDLEIVNDTIFILDSQIANMLYVFDISGKFIRKIGKKGKGPGEFVKPLSFTIDYFNKFIQILDYNKIIFYSYDGSFVKEFRIPNENFPIKIKNFDGFTYIDYDVNKNSNKSYLLSDFDSLGKIKNKWLPYQKYTMGFKQSVSIGNQLYKSEFGLKYTRLFFDTIFIISKQNITPFIAISTINKITKEEIYKANKIQNYTTEIPNFMKECKKFKGVSNYLETKNLILIQIQNNGFTQHIFLNPKNQKIDCTKYQINDDLTNTKFMSFFTTYNNFFVSIIDNTAFKQDKFIKDVKNGIVQLNRKDKQQIVKLTSESNPILIFYECRNDLLK